MTIEETFNLAIAHHRAGRLADAEVLYRQILTQCPSDPFTTNNLIVVLCATGQWDQAIAYAQKAIAFSPDPIQARVTLGNALLGAGRLDETIAVLGEVIRVQPGNIPALYILACAHSGKRELDRAIACYQKALSIQPNFIAALCNLGSLLAIKGEPDPAIELLRRALAMQPNPAVAWNTLGHVHKMIGQAGAAVDCYAKAVEIEPQNAAFDSNRLYAMHLDPDRHPDEVFREHQVWNQRHAHSLSAVSKSRFSQVDRSPDRRLRIGYVSPDFCQHVVGWSMLPLLSHHNREKFEIFCYSAATSIDGVTQMLQRHVDGWRDISRLSDQQAADLIANDRVDILVDLSVHAPENRLLIFARRPAPVQVTYLGYGGTSGMPAMGYRLTDPHLDPPDSDLSVYVEKTVWLPVSYWCYCPPQSPQISELPALSHGHVTLGSVNSFAKVSASALDLWRQILESVPNTRLLLHCAPGRHLDSVRQRFGAVADRVEFVGRQSFEQYLLTYRRVDIALDPFPYGGGITTCDAMWMGVPVVTLAGNNVVGRGGRSILTNLGLGDLIANSRAEYVRAVSLLAGELPRLEHLRKSLRQRMIDSPLMDAKRFAQDMEAAFGQMWRQWCAETR